MRAQHNCRSADPPEISGGIIQAGRRDPSTRVKFRHYATAVVLRRPSEWNGSIGGL